MKQVTVPARGPAAGKTAALLPMSVFIGLSMSDITIYPNPACGTSRITLAVIRNGGEAPTIIEYLKTPPARQAPVKLIADAGLAVRDGLVVVNADGRRV